MFKTLRANQVIAIILFILSIGYTFYAFQIPIYPIPRPVDADLFPKVLGFTMLFLSVLLFFEKDKGDIPQEETEDETQETKDLGKDGEDSVSDKTEENVTTPTQDQSESWWMHPKVQVVVTITGVLLYIFLLELAGFVLTTMLFIFLMTLYYGYRKHLINFIVAISVSIGFYFILTRALGVFLPPGFLPF
ncbi:tripartite tricarboxylate transporter TctB family protein [Thalassorhabdus alkalitolerans]|uniref:Tripartite tricarboxylate transporter TctB family protein n=1 Tax=Thalassorhabdus alkalitolerans TaxID=2282697 RepID=A0ABW0YP21_9BACI|nr:tripartite tricarboxylate transporter TctB family protein [Thalassobacillus sp. C254]